MYRESKITFGTFITAQTIVSVMVGLIYNDIWKAIELWCIIAVFGGFVMFVLAWFIVLRFMR
jgi:hypothetical protein